MSSQRHGDVVRMGRFSIFRYVVLSFVTWQLACALLTPPTRSSPDSTSLSLEMVLGLRIFLSAIVANRMSVRYECAPQLYSTNQLSAWANCTLQIHSNDIHIHHNSVPGPRYVALSYCRNELADRMTEIEWLIEHISYKSVAPTNCFRISNFRFIMSMAIIGQRQTCECALD